MFAGMLFSSPSEAAIVRFSFTGSQQNADDPAGAPAGSFYAQALALPTISGIFEYDTDNLTPSGSSPIFQAYVGRIDILLDQFATNNPDAPINISSVVDQTPGSGGDQFGGNADSITSGNVGFYNTVSFQFYDASGTAFSSQALPLDLNLSDFTAARIYLSTRYFNGVDADTVSIVTFDLTSLTNISSIPAPGAAVVFLSSLIGAAGWRRKRAAASLRA